ncbi:hypothetical protein NDU88_000852 [Pleurodeles waltl]|uniref:Uncharacterized protein n=1 Tax=Pleurodeles waltl TaxID=8319 RepID=A0AAV7MLS0_PLEWA|nr:hypothetical protein NDU88_000852 [Pleurodeles waltl]
MLPGRRRGRLAQAVQREAGWGERAERAVALPNRPELSARRRRAHRGLNGYIFIMLRVPQRIDFMETDQSYVGD